MPSELIILARTRWLVSRGGLQLETCQNGGSARVIHSRCSPVGGRPASPRKSQLDLHVLSTPSATGPRRRRVTSCRKTHDGRGPDAASEIRVQVGRGPA